MANIIISFTDTAGTVQAQYDMSQADMDRMMTAYRQIYPNDDGTPSSKNAARKSMTRAAVRGWKDGARAFEQNQAVANVPDIPVTET